MTYRFLVQMILSRPLDVFELVHLNRRLIHGSAVNTSTNPLVDSPIPDKDPQPEVGFVYSLVDAEDIASASVWLGDVVREITASTVDDGLIAECGARRSHYAPEPPPLDLGPVHAMLAVLDTRPPAPATPDGREPFICPACDFPSRHPDDITHQYCPRCRWFTADPQLAPVRPELFTRNNKTPPQHPSEPAW